MSNRKLLAIASSGGHWTQLLSIREAWSEWDVTYVSVDIGLAGDVPSSSFESVSDANASRIAASIRLGVQMLFLVLRTRPGAIVTTGAAPGLFGVMFGKAMGATTVWIDSIANAKKLSISGRLARRFSDLWLTQWPHLATPRGPRYMGDIL